MKPLGRVAGFACDVTQVNQVSKFFEAVDREFGALDIWSTTPGQVFSAK